MCTLGDFLGPPKSGAKTEWLSHTGLSVHVRKNTGQPRIFDTLQCGHEQFHKDMVGHDSGGSEGGPRRVGKWLSGGA